MDNDQKLNIYLETRDSLFFSNKKFLKTFYSMILILIAFGFSLICSWVAKFIPEIGSVLKNFTWVIILATVIPLLLAMTPAKRIESIGSSSMGSFMLYVLLTTIGARADLGALQSAPIFIIAGLVWVSIHGFILIVGGKIFRIPIAILASASQANVGGTISSPIVASVYDKSVAPISIVLAILGNIYGTSAGLLLAHICRLIMDLVK